MGEVIHCRTVTVAFVLSLHSVRGDCTFTCFNAISNIITEESYGASLRKEMVL